MDIAAMHTVQYPVQRNGNTGGDATMKAVAFSTFRKNLRSCLDQVRDDAEPLLVTSKDPSANVVVINAVEYDNLIENLSIQTNGYLMSKLLRGRKAIDEQKTCSHALAVENAADVD